jgi:histidinol dehydrogenase
LLEVIDGRHQGAPVHIARPGRVAVAADDAAAARGVVEDVRLRGDEAVLEHNGRVDRGTLEERLRVDPDDLGRARSLVPPELVDALEVMAERMRVVCEHQRTESWLERRGDEVWGEIVRPVRRAGISLPGGRGAASAVVTCVVPAQVAGVEGVAVAAPARSSGQVPDAVVAACAVVGVSEVYRMSGAPAIAALAFGTETVRPVDKIYGATGAEATHAARLAAGWVGAGPGGSDADLAIVADPGADPRLVAADLVANAEASPHGSHVLVTWAPALAERVIEMLDTEVLVNPSADTVENALIEGGRAVLVRDLDHALDTVNAFAPTSLELMVADAERLLERVRSAGAVFLGASSPPAAGVAAAGVSQLLPGGGAARWASGLEVGDFVTRTYVSGLEPSSLERLAPHVAALAVADGLPGLERAIGFRADPLWRDGS